MPVTPYTPIGNVKAARSVSTETLRGFARTVVVSRYALMEIIRPSARNSTFEWDREIWREQPYETGERGRRNNTALPDAKDPENLRHRLGPRAERSGAKAEEVCIQMVLNAEQ